MNNSNAGVAFSRARWREPRARQSARLNEDLRTTVQHHGQRADAANDAAVAAGAGQRLALIQGVIDRAAVVGYVLDELGAQGFLGLFPGNLAALAVAVGDQADALLGHA